MVLRYIDDGRFELLPSGLYARCYVRAFAATVGLDPEKALSEVEHLLPGAPDPIPALHASRPDPAEWATDRLVGLVSAVASLVAAGLRPAAAWLKAITISARGHIERSVRALAPRLEPVRGAGFATIAAPPDRRATEPWVERCRTSVQTVIGRARGLDVGAAGERVAARVRSLNGLTTSPSVSRFGAALIDAVLLLVVDSFLVLLISWSSGIPTSVLLREAAWALGAFCAIPVALYFLLFGGIAGSTLGRYVCNLVSPLGSAEGRPHHPLTLHDILRRSVRP